MSGIWLCLMIIRCTHYILNPVHSLGNYYRDAKRVFRNIVLSVPASHSVVLSYYLIRGFATGIIWWELSPSLVLIIKQFQMN